MARTTSGKKGGPKPSKKGFPIKAVDKVRGKVSPAVKRGLPKEYEDEIDAFHNDKIGFDSSEEEFSSEDLDDEVAVHDLSEDDEDGDLLDEGDRAYDDQDIEKRKYFLATSFSIVHSKELQVWGRTLFRRGRSSI